MKTAVELLQALRHKLRWFGVPIDGPVNVFGDNGSVINSAQKPEVTLSRKQNGIAYHKVREAVAAGTIRVAYVHTTLNLADLLTQPLPRVTRDTLQYQHSMHLLIPLPPMSRWVEHVLASRHTFYSFIFHICICFFG